MKLGEMLVKDDRITQEQLEQALAKQARDGGRLGSTMIEMGLIDVDTLTVYLGLELGIPIATRATMDRAKRLAVRLLTAEQATHFRCVPILIQDRQLIAAVDDPHDIEVMDELSRITGYRIIPRVAPEIRIYHYLELYYGVPRPRRYASIGDHSGPHDIGKPALPAPPLPGLPPKTDKPVSTRATPPIAFMALQGQPPGVDPAHEALRSDADQLVSQLESDDAAKAEQAPRVDPERVRRSAATTREFTAPEVFEPLDLTSTLRAMNEATQRGHVADALMAYAVKVFDVAALCIIRDNMAFGWKASGPNLDRERIETLLIPLDAPSMFRVALNNDDIFHGAPFPATLHTYMYRVLRCSPPDLASVAVIAIGKRVVNLLYGHCQDRDLLDEDVHGLRQVCAAASKTYVRLIAAKKSAGGE